MIIGYCRVSTHDQSLNSQIDKLKEFGCERIFKDVVSGAKSERKELNEMLDFARKGDMIVVFRLDRLGRGLKDLLNLIEKMEQKGINLKSLTEAMDTTSPQGKMFFQIAGAFAEFERNIIRERTMAGLASARSRGKVGGRKFKLSEDKITILKSLYSDKNIEVNSICNQLGISRTTLYNYLKKTKTD
jgi:DNA invertase Pin-like site-specific DNA recombinase